MVLVFFSCALSSCFIADHARASTHTHKRRMRWKSGALKSSLCCGGNERELGVREKRRRKKTSGKRGTPRNGEHKGGSEEKKKRDLCAIEHKVGTHSPTRLQILNTYVLTVCSFFAWVGDGEGSGYRLGTVTRSGKSGSNWWRKTN